MKKFLESILAFKFNASLIFTASTALALFSYLLLGRDLIPAALLWQLLLISLVASILQWIAFTGIIFKNISYLRRNILFAIPMLLFLVLCSWLFHWFPVGQLLAWLIFLGIFVGSFAIISLVFFFYGKITGQRYNSKLGEFKEREQK